jgi:hypothetical protein
MLGIRKERAPWADRVFGDRIKLPEAGRRPCQARGMGWYQGRCLSPEIIDSSHIRCD